MGMQHELHPQDLSLFLLMLLLLLLLLLLHCHGLPCTAVLDSCAMNPDSSVTRAALQQPQTHRLTSDTVISVQQSYHSVS